MNRNLNLLTSEPHLQATSQSNLTYTTHDNQKISNSPRLNTLYPHSYQNITSTSHIKETPMIPIIESRSEIGHTSGFYTPYEQRNPAFSNFSEYHLHPVKEAVKEVSPYSDYKTPENKLYLSFRPSIRLNPDDFDSNVDEFNEGPQSVEYNLATKTPSHSSNIRTLGEVNEINTVAHGWCSVRNSKDRRFSSPTKTFIDRLSFKSSIMLHELETNLARVRNKTVDGTSKVNR